MHHRFLFAGTAAAALLAGCQATKPATTAATATVETLGTTAVPASEFAYVYRKNNSSDPAFGTKASVQEYLDLYTNFKLKVLAAEQRGLDTTQAFRQELDGYKQQLAQPYLTEKSVTDQLVREAYDRLSKEISASHLLVAVARDASPKDTLAAYEKALSLRRRITEGGENFNTVARENSDDPSARGSNGNGGKLGYFTAMQMVYPFESAAYATTPGQVSMPVRTSFGYHLIKVDNVRPAQGEIKVAHLMIRATPGMPAADSATAKKKVDELYTRLTRRNENWEKLVGQFSEDAGSAPNGGELPAFSTGRMIPSFEEAAFKLQKPGDIAPPVQTPYGWHIIKLIEKQPVPSFEAMEPTLKSKVSKDSRSELNRAAFLKRVRRENNFVELPAVKEYVLAKADTALVQGRFAYSAPAAATGKAGKNITDNSALFTIQGQPYLVKDFLTYAQQSQRPRAAGTEPRFAMQQLYDQYVDQRLTEYEKSNLENKYEDYRMLVKEYRDGILLFQLMDEKVWSKAIEDTTGLQQFFAANQANYQWGPRVQATVISAATPELRAKAQGYFPDPASRPGPEGAGEFYLPTTESIPAALKFQPRTATLLPASKAALEELAGHMLEADTTLILKVENPAKAKTTSTLISQRQKAVLDYLTSQGIGAGRVLAVRFVPLKNGRPQPKEYAASPDALLLSGITRNPAQIEQRLNEKNPLAVQIQQRSFAKGENKAADQFIDKAPGRYQTELDGRYYTVIITKQLPAGPKALNEARGQATSDYQNYLEKEWLEQLKAQNPVKINQREVDKLITR
ncbi:peptidylprolyl isomerase [Hymenobacter actinosclerus]|uniref:Peptidyl-prolyl cis-trans isomerase SurA n=1 Tax=Hymenobacter actinosclerus TaxID=82805 RepID=A0A1I0H7J2_9BACT|nr:peptidylprolyl isomerase [Hymenobacter actinosclerus]SET79577.1 peptidyl-prolyl cis-trans isomerase SurA [Hymenobacter actinosclerus]